MRKYPPDYRLCSLIFVCLFLPIAAAWIAWEPVKSADQAVWELLCLAVTCAVVGRLLQAIAAVCGVRLSDRAAPDQAADYDDAPPSPG